MESYGSHQDPDTGLEESMWRMGIGGTESKLPERPGEPDCTFYLRTGTCSYGERCRYNHPRDHSGVLSAGRTTAGADYPERFGQPVCEFYMKTGTCRFGSTCKFHHPRQQGGGSVRQIVLNCYGFPLRPGEKECLFYMKTGNCKFGSTCKFHHPEPISGASAVSIPASSTPVFHPQLPAQQQHSVVGPAQPYPSVIANWQVGPPRPPVLPGPHFVTGSYSTVVLPSGVVPMQSWSPYPGAVSTMMTPGGQQQAIQAGPPPMYSLPSQQLSPPVPAYVGPTGSDQRQQEQHLFPERPGQPECQFYMRTGDCRYGSSCKFHHPCDRRMPSTNCALSPLGLPLRPGVQPCSYYAQHGFCKFGPTCKFDHPMGTLSYSPSASSLSDMPIAPYPIGFSVATTLAPSSSSSDLLFRNLPEPSIPAGSGTGSSIPGRTTGEISHSS